MTSYRDPNKRKRLQKQDFKTLRGLLVNSYTTVFYTIYLIPGLRTQFFSPVMSYIILAVHRSSKVSGNIRDASNHTSISGTYYEEKIRAP